MNNYVCKKTEVSYYLIYEKPYVFQFLKKRYSTNTGSYKSFIKYPDDIEYSWLKITIERTIEKDIPRLNNEIDFINHILLQYPYMDDLAGDYLVGLEKLKQKYNSLLKKSIKAIEDYENRIVEEQGEKEPEQ